jgi:hypothetical protein
MAVKLITNYAKRLGLPGYSSHQFSVSIETELPNLDSVAQDSARLYESLQEVVDRQIQKTGFVPPDGYGMDGEKTGTWNCSKKQRDLIEKIIQENNLDQTEIEQLATGMFGLRLQQLNKLQASGFIDELLDRHGNGKRNGFRQRRSRSGTGVQKGATA